MNFDKKLKVAELLVYNGGVLYEKFETSNGKFDIALPINNTFMFEFKVNNHYSKRIAFNTETECLVGDIPELYLTMKLIPKDIQYLAKEDLDLLDFPVAYIAFDCAKKEFFDINKSYSKILNNEIDQNSQKFLAGN
jgi:hypothetical protein